MTIAEEKLLAYVDGYLPPDEAAEIERALESDEDAQALVASLRASALPYREAAETLIDVPDLSGIERSLSAPRPRPAPDPAPMPYQTPMPRRVAAAAALALFFVVGALAGHYAIPPAPPSTPTEQTQWARWLDDIATYQALYTRETLSLPNPPAERRARQMERVSRALGQPLGAPDFTAANADFKYARMYGLDGEPLAQIAYLPKEGPPFSLCMMKTDKPDHEPRYTRLYGMEMATWRHRGIAWVFVGGVSKAEMERYIALARTQLGA